MRLTYWKCQCTTDHNAYSVRKPTKKAAIAAREESKESHGSYQHDPPKKVTIEYSNGFDLMIQLTGEDGGCY